MNTATLVRPAATATRPKSTRRLWTTAGVVAGAFLLGWVALHLRPAPFPPIATAPTAPALVPLPDGLPAPVERFYRQRYGEQVPEIRSAVITGRGTMRLPPLFNLIFPARFRFTHDAGRSYRHYIEVTLFGLPVLKVNEYFVDGKERQELPWAIATDNPKLDQGGNLGMWSEVLHWIPAVLLTDPNVRWEPIDDETALLVVPFGDELERFVVRFSATTGELLYWEVMRYADGEGEKTLWINGTWFEDGRPWFVIEEDNVVVNVEVDTSLSAKGP